MCDQTIQDFWAQKFGRPRGNYGIGNAEKALNGFDRTVYYPTNWRGTYEPLESKIPNLFLRYGGTTIANPMYYQKNYLGAFPLKQQPVVKPPEPFTQSRFS